MREPRARAAARTPVGGTTGRSPYTVVVSQGRLNDLIHAAGIVLALPHLLEDGEEIAVRPSLAAGNDPHRPFDLETDRRVAEFKLARWRGADAMRKRQTFKDLVMLAADRTGRRAELFVVGPEPGRFMRSSPSATPAMSRSPTCATCCRPWWRRRWRADQGGTYDRASVILRKAPSIRTAPRRAAWSAA
ncbi:hypothetical protein [Streptomyces sp. NPDC058086]|uniref:hypothetical protein n=1 Tax=Streptomyces sp. NPDC058086 TaxID=3346334 RepID=UPI0036E7B087